MAAADAASYLNTWLAENVVKNEPQFIEKFMLQQSVFTSEEASDIYTMIQDGGNPSGSGASNTVRIEDITGKQIAVRIALDCEFARPWYYFGKVFNNTEPQYDIVRQKSRPMDENERLELILKNREIWEKTSDGLLAPELYFYGYIQIDGKEKLCIINAAQLSVDERREKERLVGTAEESYRWKTMNLEEFLDSLTANGGRSRCISTINVLIQIGNYLKHLFTMMVKKQILCFDIKPANTIIYFMKDAEQTIYSNSIILKLIDMDADACRDFPITVRGDENQVELYTNIMLMIMGNFFHEWWSHAEGKTGNFLIAEGINIFEPIKSNENFVTQMIIAIALGGAYTIGNRKPYIFYADHYFQYLECANYDPETSTIDDYKGCIQTLFRNGCGIELSLEFIKRVLEPRVVTRSAGGK